jgi:hypothetical protein
MWVAISSGVYRTTDGGRHGCHSIRAEFMPEKYPEFGQCVHKVVQHPSRAGRLFAQNHWGLYRSDDAGDSWRDIARGVPSDFGFAMTIHPDEPDTVYIIPIQSDMVRVAPEEKLRVSGRETAGVEADAAWQRRAYDIVLRDAMTTDSLDPAGVFRTRNGGSTRQRTAAARGVWRSMVPSITCVRAVVAEDRQPARRPAPRRAARR